MEKEKNNKKILIIEDDVNLRDAMTRRFTAENFTAFSAAGGESGFALAIKEEPDIILLDIMMPGMNGMEVMKKLRGTNEWGKRVPIILLTSLKADDHIMQGVVEDEPAYYFMKDKFSLSDVVEKVNERLSRVQQ